MKTNWIRTLTLSAAALTLGSAAYGQSRMIAEIPFSFEMNGTKLPAGHYSVERAQGLTSNVVLLTDGHNLKMAMGIQAASREYITPRLIFSCAEVRGCALTQVWDRYGNSVQFAKPKLSGAEKERLAVVILRRSEAE